MKKNKFSILIISAILTFGCLTGCNSSKEDPTVTKNTFTLNETLKELTFGESFKLSAYFSTGNVEKITWTSSNTGVVSVTENGYVTAQSIGNAVVVAETESCSASCKFVVQYGNYLPELIIKNIDNDKIILGKDSDFIINAKVNYNNKYYDTSFDVYDYDENIISYESGTITAKNVGTTKMLVSGKWNNSPEDLINKIITVTVVDNISFYCEVNVDGTKKITNDVKLYSVDSWRGKNYCTKAVIEPTIYINGQYHLADFEIADEEVLTRFGNVIKANNPGTSVVDLSYYDASSQVTYYSSILVTVNCPVEIYGGDTVRFSAEEQFPVDPYFGSGAKIISASQNGKDLYVHDNYIDGLDQLGPDSKPVEIITDKGGYRFPNVFIYTKLINKTNIVDSLKLSSGSIKTGYYLLDEDILDESISFSGQIASNSSTYFAGVFDGQGHAINALVGPNGVFGGFGKGATIKDCKFNFTFNLASDPEHKKESFSGLASNASTFINNEWDVTLENLYVTTTNFEKRCHALFEYRPNNLIMNNTYIEINGVDALEEFTNVNQDYAALFRYDVTPLTGPSNQYFGDMRNNYVVLSKFMPLANGNFEGMKGRYVSYARNDEAYLKKGNDLSIVHSSDKAEQSRYRIVYPHKTQATDEQKLLYGLINVPELVTTGVIPSIDTPMAALYGSSYSDGGIFRYDSKANISLTKIGTWTL